MSIPLTDRSALSVPPFYPSGDDVPCVFDPGACSTGAAAGTNFSWVCPATVPFGSLPSGSGDYCYTSQAACMSGPNLCDESNCVVMPSMCSTGIAAGASSPPSSFFCTLDLVPDAIPNGSGELCYADLRTCIHGSNKCTLDNPCVSSVSDCQSGQAAASSATHNYICLENVPAQAQAILSGQYCYTTKEAWCACG